MSGSLGHDRTVLLYEASMTPANSRAYDGVSRYAEQAGWIVQKQPYSLAAEKLIGILGAKPTENNRRL